MMPRRRRSSRKPMRSSPSSRWAGRDASSSSATGTSVRAGGAALRTGDATRGLDLRWRHQFHLAIGSALSKQLREPGHERLVGEIKLERGHGDAAVGDGGKIGAVRGRRALAPGEGEPIIGIAAAVVARLDAQEFLVALALAGDRDAAHLLG